MAGYNHNSDCFRDKTKIGRRKKRNSNLEQYRIIVMLLIVAHHYVVNSGLFQVIQEAPFMTTSSAIMLVFGAWGKTGINCFLFITGYFMSKSKFSWNKLLKLYIQIVFYSMVIYGIFCITGHETFTYKNIILRLRPVWEFRQDFVSCFMMFFLFIPILNILINSISKKEHQRLIFLLLFFYCIFPTFPKFHIDFNYVSWFVAIYIMASYVRLYGISSNITHKMWGLITILLIFIGSLSVICLYILFKNYYLETWTPYYFLSDSNRIIPVLIALSSFMYFKNLKMPHSRLINAAGGATFGVLLIHANSDAMRNWLWKETINCIGNLRDDIVWTLGYALGSVLIIFIVCAGIDWFRGRFIEPHF